jgi:hypothetical protein
MVIMRLSGTFVMPRLAVRVRVWEEPLPERLGFTEAASKAGGVWAIAPQAAMRPVSRRVRMIPILTDCGRRWLANQGSRWIYSVILCEIPSPPFKEELRARE